MKSDSRAQIDLCHKCRSFNLTRSITDAQALYGTAHTYLSIKDNLKSHI